MTILFVLISALPVNERIASYYHSNGKTSPSSPYIPCVSDPAKLCPNPAYHAAIVALGLNQPIPVQWAIYMANALTFQWGYVSDGSALGTGEASAGLPELHGQAVFTVLSNFLPYTIELAALSLVIILIISIPLGNLSAVNRNRPIDQASRVMSFSGYAIPSFLLGSFALAVAAIALGGAGNPSPICGHQGTIFLDFWGSWPTAPCSSLYGTTNLGPTNLPAWLIQGYISTPTGYPTLDAAIHGQVLAGAGHAVSAHPPRSGHRVRDHRRPPPLRPEQHARGHEPRLHPDGAGEGTARIHGDQEARRPKLAERDHHRSRSHLCGLHHRLPGD